MRIDFLTNDNGVKPQAYEGNLSDYCPLNKKPSLLDISKCDVISSTVCEFIKSNQTLHTLWIDFRLFTKQDEINLANAIESSSLKDINIVKCVFSSSKTGARALFASLSLIEKISIQYCRIPNELYDYIFWMLRRSKKLKSFRMGQIKHLEVTQKICKVIRLHQPNLEKVAINCTKFDEVCLNSMMGFLHKNHKIKSFYLWQPDSSLMLDHYVGIGRCLATCSKIEEIMIVSDNPPEDIQQFMDRLKFPLRLEMLNCVSGDLMMQSKYTDFIQSDRVQCMFALMSAISVSRAGVASCLRMLPYDILRSIQDYL